MEDVDAFGRVFVHFANGVFRRQYAVDSTRRGTLMHPTQTGRLGCLTFAAREGAKGRSTTHSDRMELALQTDAVAPFYFYPGHLGTGASA